MLCWKVEERSCIDSIVELGGTFLERDLSLMQPISKQILLIKLVKTSNKICCKSWTHLQKYYCNNKKPLILNSYR